MNSPDSTLKSILSRTGKAHRKDSGDSDVAMTLLSMFWSDLNFENESISLYNQGKWRLAEPLVRILSRQLTNETARTLAGWSFLYFLRPPAFREVFDNCYKATAHECYARNELFANLAMFLVRYKWEAPRFSKVVRRAVSGALDYRGNSALQILGLLPRISLKECAVVERALYDRHPSMRIAGLRCLYFALTSRRYTSETLLRMIRASKTRRRIKLLARTKNRDIKMWAQFVDEKMN